MPNEFSRNEYDGLRQQLAENPDSVSTQRLMDAVMTSIMKTGTLPDRPEMTNLGQIQKMQMPAGWEAGPDYSHRDHSYTYHEFHPQGQKDCQLGFYYRGRRTSEVAGRNFNQILDAPAHELTPAEYSSLGEVLRDKAKAEDFTVKSARTEDINGKRVLVVEGRYNVNQNDSFHVFVDSDNSGTAVQEVFFQAPKDKFAKYGADAEQSIRKVRWR